MLIETIILTLLTDYGAKLLFFRPPITKGERSYREEVYQTLKKAGHTDEQISSQKNREKLFYMLPPPFDFFLLGYELYKAAT